MQDNVDINNEEVASEEVNQTNIEQPIEQQSNDELSSNIDVNVQMPMSTNGLTVKKSLSLIYKYFGVDLGHLVSAQQFSAQCTDIADKINNGEVTNNQRVSEGDRLILMLALILVYLCYKSNGISEELTNKLVNNSPELLDEFSTFGFYSDNPFPEFLFIVETNRCSITEDSYAVVHNAVADEILNPKDLVGKGIFRLKNVIFNSSFYTKITNSSDMEHMLKIQNKLRNINNDFYNKFNENFSKFLKDLQPTGNLTADELRLLIVVYRTDRAVLEENGKYVLDTTYTFDNVEVRTTSELTSFLANHKDESQETQSNLYGSKLTKLPDNITGKKLSTIIKFLDERLSNTELHNELCNLDKWFNNSMSFNNRIETMNNCINMNLDIWNKNVLHSIIRDYLDKRKPNAQQSQQNIEVEGE